MSKIKKIVFMIVICLACIFIHNVSLAAEIWKDKGSFSLSQGSCSNKSHKNCTTYSTGKTTMHIGKDGFMEGSDKPVLDSDKGLLCLQHDKEAETFGENGVEIQYLMEISERNVTITPMSKAAKESSGTSTITLNSSYSAQVAYILSHTSNSVGWDVRKENGTQGALWKIIPSFWKELMKKTDFTDVIGDSISSSATKTAAAKKIWEESIAYNTYAKSNTSASSKVNTKIKVSELDNNYYIIGPFKMTFASGSCTYGGDVIKFAGFDSANLKMDQNTLKSNDWILCDENGEKISEPTNNTDFYIKVKKGKIGAKGSLNITTKRMKVDAEWYTMTSPKGRQEEAIITSARRYYETDEVTFEFDTFGNLRIAKKDADSGNALSGIGFTIKNSNGKYVQALDANKNVQASATGIIKNIQFTGSKSKATTFTTNEQGIIELHNITVDTYTVEEVSVGEHYAYSLNGSNITWEANGKTNTGQSMNVLIKGQPPNIANSTNTMLSDEYVTITTVKNKKQVGQLNIKKVDDRNMNKILQKVEFVIRSSASNNQYIRVKTVGDNVTNDTNGWATRIVGSSRINDTKDVKNNPTLEYTSNISEATVFVTNEYGIIDIQNLISSIDGKTMIEYKLEEIANPNYGYLSGNSDEYVNYKVKYEGKSTTTDGTIKLITSDEIEVIATNHQEYIRLEGFVWEDIVHGKENAVNNKYDETEALVGGIQVKLYKGGTLIKETLTDKNGKYQFGTEKDSGYYENTDYVKDGKETGDLRIDDLSQYYVEFEYDGLKYTSVAVDKDYSSANYKITSKAEEIYSGRKDEKDRENVNSDFEIISNNQAHSKTKDTYKLDYEFENHMSKYDYNKYWEYITDENGNLYVKKVENKENKNYEVIASTRESGFDLETAWEAQFQNSGSEVLKGINLGIEKRAQADLALSSDLNTVDIKIKNETKKEAYMNTYTYAKRGIDTDKNNVNDENTEYYGETDPTTFGIETKFGTSSGSYSSRGLNLYTRRIYESDLAYNKENSGLMEVYVTYKIRVKNQSTKLTSKVNEIANYFDKRYDVEASWLENENQNDNNLVEWSVEKSNAEGYKVGHTKAIEKKEIEPGKYIDIYIKFKLNNDAVSELIQKRTTLNNVSEITSFSTVENEKPYAAIDIDSNPGSAEIELKEPQTTTTVKLNERDYEIEDKTLNTTTYEDDTDMAPSLVLGIEEDNPTRGLSGTVFEDTQTLKSKEDNERLGDGILSAEEKNRIKNAKVELLEYDESKSNHIATDESGKAKVATLYELSSTNDVVSTTKNEAIVYTDENGEYSFKGVIPGRYLIRYTYGKGSFIIDENKNEIEINARDYKSTIITSDLIKNALSLGKEPERMGDLNWILTKEMKKVNDEEEIIRYSDATDDISKRNTKDDLYYGSYSENFEMTSDTAFFDIGVEYSEVQEENSERVSYTDYTDEYVYDLENEKVLVFDEDNNILKVKPTFYAVNPYQDFGIIERPRQQYDVNKRVSNLKVTLANGQILINGNPYKNVAATSNIKDLESSSENPLPYVKAVPSLVSAEIDNEILQGAKLNIEYTISIKNNSEKDYDYIKNQDYYYYGENRGEQIKAVIRKVVDYMEDSLIYDGEKSGEGWTQVTPEDLKKYNEDGIDKKLIADEVYNDIKQGYTISITEAFYGNGNGIGVGEIASTTIYGSKVLSTSEKGINVENHAEIIETMGIRSIKGSTPGNYNPKKGKPDEPDDDMTSLTITGPTGSTDNKTFVILVTTTALLILAGGVYIIKKKVI